MNLMEETKLKRKDLIWPDLSYQIVGVLFEVWTSIGFGHKEKVYQKATAKRLQDVGLKFEQQLPVKINFKNATVGIYYFDFLIENKVVLEIKVRNFFSKKDIDQLYSYLKIRNLKLGLIAHFTKTGIKFKRIVNLN